MTAYTDPPDVNDLDAVASAIVDGEATTDEAARVAVDPSLAARVATMRAVAERVAAVGTPPAGLIDAAVSRALDAHEPPSEAPAPVVGIDRYRRRQRILSVAAAALLAVLGGAAVLAIATQGGDDNDDAGTALEAEAERDESAGADGADDSATLSVAEDSGAGTGGAPTTTVPAGGVLYLGTIDDPAHLVASVEAALDRNADYDDPPADVTPEAAPAGDVCSAERPAPQTVVFDATADYDGEPAVVVVYEDDTGARRVVALAVDGCGVLADIAL